ncbi:hypothetical protein GF351_01885 [Candidatus Woesearchaeota archaeon]|nr:hypothetical protein [Candidatus Woesearchaeota archaeon]
MEQETKDKLEKGAVLARIIQEVLGKPKEHVEEAIAGIVKAIKDQPDIDVQSTKVFPAEENEEGAYLAFAEMEVLFKDLPRLIGFCFDFVPGSVEVVEPTHFDFSVAYLNDIMNDLMVKLHGFSMKTKNLTLENNVLRKRGTELLRNLVILAVGNRERTVEEICGTVGIPADQLRPYIDILVKEGRLAEKEGKLSLLQK